MSIGDSDSCLSLERLLLYPEGAHEGQDTADEEGT